MEAGSLEEESFCSVLQYIDLKTRPQALDLTVKLDEYSMMTFY